MSSPPNRDQIDFLKTVLPFSRLKVDDLIKISFDLREKKYPPKTLLFHQADSSTELYIVKRGKVRVYKEALSHTEITIVVFGPGDVIGEYSIIDNQPRSTAAKTVGQATLWQINRERFLYHLHTIPALGVGMCDLLVSKARWCATYADTIAQYDGASRFLRLMMQYNEQWGQDGPNGERIIDFGMTQVDLASLAGISRTTLNRKLNDWHKRGILRYHRRKIILYNTAAIQIEIHTLGGDKQ